MSKSVWKFKVEESMGPWAPQTIQMPAGAKPVAVGLEPSTEVTCVWALVDTEAPLQDYTFLFIGTGGELPKAPGDTDWEHVGTAGLDGGQNGKYVWHVFWAV
jgi:hypothetical protein